MIKGDAPSSHLIVSNEGRVNPLMGGVVSLSTGEPDYYGGALMPEHDQASQNHAPIVLEVSPTTWQVRVGLNGQPGSLLLGYIQRVGDVFEATDLARPLDIATATTIDQAAASITGGVAVS